MSLAGRARAIAEAIEAFHLEPGIRRRDILHCVGRAQAVVVVVDVARRGKNAAEEVITRDALNHIDKRVILTAERDSAVLVAGQPHERLTTKLTATLVQFARARVKAAFQLEDRFQSTTQVFRTLDTPAVAIHVAVNHPHLFFVAIGVVHIADACVDDAVKRDAGLRVGCAREASKRNCERG